MTSPADLPREEALRLWNTVNVDPESDWTWQLENESEVAVVMRLIAAARSAAYRAGRLAGLEEAAKLDHDDILDVAAAIRALKDRV